MKIKITYIGWWGSMKVRGLNPQHASIPAPPPLSPDLDMSHTTPRCRAFRLRWPFRPRLLRRLCTCSIAARTHSTSHCPHVPNRPPPAHARPATAPTHRTDCRPSRRQCPPPEWTEDLLFCPPFGWASHYALPKCRYYAIKVRGLLFCPLFGWASHYVLAADRVVIDLWVECALQQWGRAPCSTFSPFRGSVLPRVSGRRSASFCSAGDPCCVLPYSWCSTLSVHVGDAQDAQVSSVRFQPFFFMVATIF
jgi:hypothetical protein